MRNATGRTSAACSTGGDKSGAEPRMGANGRESLRDVRELEAHFRPQLACVGDPCRDLAMNRPSHSSTQPPMNLPYRRLSCRHGAGWKAGGTGSGSLGMAARPRALPTKDRAVRRQAAAGSVGTPRPTGLRGKNRTSSRRSLPGFSSRRGCRCPAEPPWRRGRTCIATTGRCFPRVATRDPRRNVASRFPPPSPTQRVSSSMCSPRPTPAWTRSRALRPRWKVAACK